MCYSGCSYENSNGECRAKLRQGGLMPCDMSDEEIEIAKDEAEQAEYEQREQNRLDLLEMNKD